MTATTEIKSINNEKLANLICKSSSHISNILRLLELDKKKKGLIFSNGKSYLRIKALLEVNSGLVMGYAKKFKQQSWHYY